MFEKIHVTYINLDKRVDRKENVINELLKLGIKEPIRFKAIELANGSLGCSFSHLKCIENAKQKNYDSVFVCEDDIEFLNPELLLNQLKTFLDSNIEWDVIIIAGNNVLPFIPINSCCIKVFNCQTTTGYIVKNHYYDTLINNYKEGISQLIKDPTNNQFKIDKYWFHLQRINNWYLIIPLSVVQREDYSDIEKKITNFKNYMLNYNKVIK
jgi:hypothetical protein